MTASEKLEALERATRTAVEYLEANGQGRKDEIVSILRDLVAALPQIRALVEAVEKAHHKTWGPEFFDLRSALAALDKALGEQA